MARRPDIPCSVCGELMWRGRGVLPVGEATCQPCRRATGKGRRSPTPTREATCITCGKQFITARPEALACSRSCNYRSPNEKARHAARQGAKVGRPRFSPVDVAARDGWNCGICGGMIPPADQWPAPLSLSIDHIIPLSEDGEHDWSNVQAAHLRCNLSKGARIA